MMSMLLRTSRLLALQVSASSSPSSTASLVGITTPPHRHIVGSSQTPTIPPLVPSSSVSSSVKITESCENRLRQILESGNFLRVSVEGGGCSGFQYNFQIDHQLSSDDIIIHRDRDSGKSVGDTKNTSPLVVTDEMSLDLIRGSTLDYETELIRSTFRVINNPLAEQGCSCGASFNMKI